MVADSTRQPSAETTLGQDWLREASAELAHLGFVLRDGLLTGTVPGPRLLVALRDRPTLEHFDPEEITFWEAHAGRGRLALLTREVETPRSQPFSWGRIRITDRVPVSNQFLSFGGTLLVDRPDERSVIAALASKAPIVRWSGHSQGTDPFADEIGSFFARLKVPVDYQPGAEARIAAASPEALYAVSLKYAEARLRAAPSLREAEPALAVQVAHEGHRLATDIPDAWAEGEALYGWLELG